MYDDRLTFQLTHTDAHALQRLAQRLAQRLSQLCRDAIALLLADLPRYYALLSARVLEHAKPPTPEQQAAFQEYLRTHPSPDLSAVAASMPQPPGPWAHAPASGYGTSEPKSPWRRA